jgi:transcriptional regulator with XRE-family HTH domain
MDRVLEDALDAARARKQLPEPSLRRLLRERAGVSQAVLATAVGVDRASVSRWESGRRTPRGEQVERYRAVLQRLTGALVADAPQRADLHPSRRANAPTPNPRKGLVGALEEADGVP